MPEGRVLIGTAGNDHYRIGPEVVLVFDQSEPDVTLAGDHGGRTVTVVANTRSPGLAGARNSGIALADTELVAFCDDDDRWLPGKLSRQVEVFRADPGARFVSCGIQVRYGDRLVERSMTDEIMYALMELTGQTYVDMYAASVKERAAALQAAPSPEKRAS